jgi:exoribonuclease II
MRQKRKNIKDVADELYARRFLAEHQDIDKRFGEYDDDMSVGGMYARKKKNKKSKTKRNSKKKDCGCK